MFYDRGALVFGGGHVVLPLLNEASSTRGGSASEAFLAGYGLAQAMPGPLFTFSAYLGAIEEPAPNGVAGRDASRSCAIFLPSFLLLGAVLPVWSSFRQRMRVQAALTGVGAAVVGLLAAALWNPVLTTAVDDVATPRLRSHLVTLRVLPVWAVVPLAAASVFCRGVGWAVPVPLAGRRQRLSSR